jgi:isopentenyl-diphosphate delta-isomerase
MYQELVEKGVPLQQFGAVRSIIMEDPLIIVNEKDEMVGVGEKLKVHRDGLLHRAFSIFIFNSYGELLLQRRALSKYHSPGLWSNTCCGHPRPGEQVLVSAQLRLKAEMGLDCHLDTFGSLIYRADVGDGLIEHEFDHLLIGHSELEPTLNIEEAMGWRRVAFATLGGEVRDRPDDFTYWLRVILDTRSHKFPIAFKGAHDPLI